MPSRSGPDLSRFPMPAHFCSWLTLAPGTRISGGKRLKGPVPKRFNRAGQALRLAASTARNNKTYIGACHRTRLRRLDAARANKATAHQLARLIYAILTRGEEYVEREIADFEAERRERQIRTSSARPATSICCSSMQKTRPPDNNPLTSMFHEGGASLATSYTGCLCLSEKNE